MQRGDTSAVRRLAVWLLPALLLAACAPATRAPAAETDTRQSAPRPSATPAAAAPTRPPAQGEAGGAASTHPAIPDATYGQEGDVAYVKIPTTECANLTATPIVVGDWLVYPMHEHGRGCQNHSPYWHALFGYHLREGKLYLLYEGSSGEAPLLYDPAGETVYWNVVNDATVLTFEADSFALKRRVNLQATSDSSGTILDGLYYLGTINSPDPVCQRDPINPNCGALFALDGDGNVVHRLTTEQGFRAWIGTGATTDGEFLYWGTAAQTVREKTGDETEYLYGCSVVKTDRELNVLAAFDPGDLACYKLPYEGANMDSLSGEVVPDGKGLWAQYVRPNDESMKTVLYRLDLDLRERCRVAFDFEPQTQTVGFYGAPTVDREGNAYVPATVPDGEETRRAQLWRVTPDCQATLLAEVPGAWAQASPTLADDRYVLFATDGRLQVLTMEGQPVRDVALASPARVLTAPVLYEGSVYVVQEDGTLNILRHSGLAGYGQALWPRYRHDNAGSGALAP